MNQHSEKHKKQLKIALLQSHQELIKHFETEINDIDTTIKEFTKEQVLEILDETYRHITNSLKVLEKKEPVNRIINPKPEIIT